MPQQCLHKVNRVHSLFFIFLFPFLWMWGQVCCAQGKFSARQSGEWTNPTSWTLISGPDAGNNGYPDGLDSAVILSSTSAAITVSLSTEVEVACLWIEGGLVADGVHEVDLANAAVLRIGEGGLRITEGNSDNRIARFSATGALTSVFIKGDLQLVGTVPDRSQLSITSSAAIHLSRNCDLNSGFSRFTNTGGYIRFIGTDVQYITGNFSANHLVINKPNANPVVAGGTITDSTTEILGMSRLNIGLFPDHALGQVSGTGTLMITAPNHGNTVFPNGNFTGFLAPAGQGTIEYFGEDTIRIEDPPPTGNWYAHVVISGVGPKTIGGPVTIEKDLLIQPESSLENAGFTMELTQGNLLVNGRLNFTSPASSVLVFSNKSELQTISGNGSIRLRDLYLDKASFPLSLLQHVLVEGNLQWQSDGFVDLNSKDLILGPSSVLIPNGQFDSTCMVRMDGSSGPGSIVKRATASTQFRMEYPIGTQTNGVPLYTPFVVSKLDATVLPGDTAWISIKTVPFASGRPDVLKRFWRVKSSGLTNVTDARMTFFFRPQDVSGSPDFVTRTENLTTFPVPSSFIATDRFGVNTTGNVYLEEEWGISKLNALPKTYFSFQNGNWSDPATWTTDPTGSTHTNPPPAGGPNNQDRVVVLPGDSVLMDQNTRNLSGIQLHGRSCLTLGTSFGHGFNQIQGKGHLRLSTTDLPTGNYTDFVAADSGTIEFMQSGGFVLPPSMPVYHNLILNIADSATLLHHLTIHGSLTIARGTFKINNDASPTRLLVTIARDLMVKPTGKIKTGLANVHDLGATGASPNAGQYFTLYHGLSIGRNFKNEGSVRFTNLTQPVLNQNAMQGAVTVFLDGKNSGKVQLDGPTDFQNLVVNKEDFGTEVELTSSDVRNFRLFGRVDLPNIGSSGDPEVRKSLILHQGTLRLAGQLLIPTLTEAQGSSTGTAAPARYGPHYTIPNRSHLILAGPDVKVYISANNQSQTRVGNLEAADLGTWIGGDEGLMVQGSLTVENGLLESRNCAGIVYRPTGGTRGITVLGGVVRVTQFRGFPLAGGNYTYLQQGGTVEVTGKGFGGAGYVPLQAAFNLNNLGHQFHMTGGILRLSGALSATVSANPVLLDIQSNISSATGGLIEFAPDSVWSNGKGIYDYILSNNTQLFDMAIRKVRGSVTIRSRNQTTLNGSLFIGGHSSLQMRDRILQIGGNFTLNGGFFHHVNPITSSNSTLSFRATVPGTTQTMTINEGSTFDFSVVELRPQTPNAVGNTLKLDGSLVSKAITFRGLRYYDNNSLFDDGGFTLTLSEFLLAGNGAAHVGTGKIIANNTRTGAFTFHGNGIVNHIDLMDPDGFLALGDIQFAGNVQYEANSLFNIQSTHIRFLASSVLNMPSAGVSKMFVHNGNPNAGGIIRSFSPGSVSWTFPIGTEGKFRPVTATFTASTYGRVTVRPVPTEHPNTTFSHKALQQYWKIIHSGFSGVTSSRYQCFYGDEDVPAGQSDDGYKIGIWPFNSSWQTQSYNTQSFNHFLHTAGSLRNIDLTAGGDSAFMQPNSSIFVSIKDGDWHSPGTWKQQTLAFEDIPGENPSTTVPGTLNRVIISEGDTITVNENTAIDVPSLRFDQNSMLDLGSTTNQVMHSFGTVSTNLSGSEAARLRITSALDSAQFPGGNWTEFLISGPGVRIVQYYFSGIHFRLPTWSQGKQHQLNRYSKLEIDHRTGVIALCNQSIVLNSMEIWSSTIPGGKCITSTQSAMVNVLFSTGPCRIGKNGHLQLSARQGMANRTFSLNTNTPACTLEIASTGRLDIENSGTNLIHEVWLNEGLTNNGGILNCIPGTHLEPRILLCFNGSRNGSINGFGTNRIWRLHIEKNTISTTVSNNYEGLQFINATTGSENHLSLVRGSYIQNHPSQHLVLRKGVHSAEYRINSNSHLIVRAGVVSLISTGINAGLRLDGQLTVDGSGKLKLASASGQDNYLGISLPGAKITIATTDSVIIGSQLKGIGATAAPNFTMSSGVLEIGRQGAPDQTRGMFAIAGPQSRMKITGGKILIMGSVGAASVGDVHIERDSTAVCSGGTFQLGSSYMPFNSRFTVQNKVGFFNLRLFNPGGLNPALENRLYPLTVFSNDTLDPGSTKIMNNFDLNIGKSLVKMGSYQGGTGTLRFLSEASNQTLSGQGTLVCAHFESVNSNPAGSHLDIQIPVTVSGNLKISPSDSIELGENTMKVAKTVTNSGCIATSTGRLLLNGQWKQTITGSTLASFGQTEFANSSGFSIQRSFHFSGHVIMTSGILDLLSHRMILGPTTLIQGEGFGASKYIKTTGTLADSGVTRLFDPGTASFFLPVGMSPGIGQTKFTPAHIQVLENTGKGSITVKAINQKHPNTLSISQSELNYYWKVDSSGFENLRAKMTFQYDQLDANTRGNENNYTVGRYSSNSWISGKLCGSVNASTNTLSFDGDTAGYLPFLGGDFTAGEPFEFIIPPPLLTNGSGGGNWDAPSTWSLQSVPPAGAGIRVVGSDVLTLTTNNKTAARVILDEPSTLALGTTKGHRFGTLLGKGKMALASDSLPEGNYEFFTGPGGGSIEYQASMAMPTSRVVYNHLIVNVVSGLVTTPDAALTFHGNLRIRQGVLSDTTNRRITVGGNLIVENGASFLTGGEGSNEQIRIGGNTQVDGNLFAGERRFLLNGNLDQTLGGTRIPKLNHLEINKPSGNVLLKNHLKLGKSLVFNGGDLILGPFDLQVDSTARFDNPSSSSYIQAHQSGNVIRALSTVPVPPDFALYPIGDSIGYKPVSVQLHSATLQSGAQLEVRYTPEIHPEMSLGASRYLPGYWSVTPTGMSAPFAYDISYGTGNPGDLVNYIPSDPNPIQAYKWNEAGWTKGGTYNPEAALFTWNNLNSFSDFTGGTNLEEIPLPLTLLHFDAHPEDNQKVEVQWRTASEQNLSHFIVERWAPSHNPVAIARIEAQSTSGSAASDYFYRCTDQNPLPGMGFYRLKMVDEDNRFTYSQTVAVQQKSRVTFHFYPNPLHHSPLTVEFFTDDPTLVEWKISDAFGKTIAKGKNGLTANRVLHLEGTSHLPSGLYQIEIRTASESRSFSVVVE